MTEKQTTKAGEIEQLGAGTVAFAFGAGRAQQVALTPGTPALAVATAPDHSFALVHSDYKIVDISAYLPALPAPLRKEAEVSLHRPDSFVDYVKAHKDEDTLITADLQAKSLTAIIDYHGKGDRGPRFWEHRAEYAFRHTVEWNRWKDIDGKGMSQVAFARFIEDNIPDIAEPDGARLLEMTQHLNVKKNVNFTSGTRLSNGETQLVYEEAIQESTAKGAFSFPERLVLALEPFEGTRQFAVEARVRYRVSDDKKLVLWVDLLRTHKVIEVAFTEIVEQVQQGLPDVQLVHGCVLED